MELFDFKKYSYDYSKRAGNLINESKSEPISKKDFPYFYEDGKKIIFKPLSKTKPLTTPMFGYSEVVWSTIFHHFFDEKIPIYHLAECTGIEEAMPSKYNTGVIVESVCSDSEYIMSLYEYFLLHPEAIVAENINDDYVNYCLKCYDYTFFYETEFIKNNPEYGRKMAEAILYSLLRADQNFHYENISFLTENGIIKDLVVPIDHEFSTMFLYPDNPLEHTNYFGGFLRSLLDEYYGSYIRKALLKGSSEEEKRKMASTNYCNIKRIVSLYPDIIEDFIKNIQNMLDYLEDNSIHFIDDDYMIPFNSESYRIGRERYKSHSESDAKRLEGEIKMIEMNPEDMGIQITQEIITSSKLLKSTLEKTLTMV